VKIHRTSIRKHPKLRGKYIVTNYAGNEYTITGKAEANRVVKASKAVAAKRRANK
jgi:hypothetical protein